MLTANAFNPQCITYSEMNVIFNARIAWRRLTTWTRAYIISRYMGVGTPEELFSILYLEVQNLSDLLQLIFGRESSQRNVGYLTQYSIILRDLITAQLDEKMEEIQQNIDRLYNTINEHAAFLASINPYWNEAEWKEMLQTYFQYTLEEANEFASGDYQRDIEIFDLRTELTNRMGDVFAQGMYDYITSGLQNTRNPEQDSQQCITLEQMNVIYDIRMFWFELNTWVRSFMLSRYRGIGDVNEVFNRLQQVPVDYVNNLKLIFGENPAIDELQLELNTYIDLIDNLITAQMAGDPDGVSRITQLLYQNADERAKSVSKLNPFWTEEEWRIRLHNNLRSTFAESNTFLAGEYARNLEIFSMLLDLAESTSGYFAEGLINYIFSQPKSQGFDTIPEGDLI